MLVSHDNDTVSNDFLNENSKETCYVFNFVVWLFVEKLVTIDGVSVCVRVRFAVQ